MMGHYVVAVILLRPEEMLLCHRAPGRRWYPDVWDFPGGHVEPGENHLDALRREVAEELGAQLEGVDGDPVLRRVDPQRNLDLTVWDATCRHAELPGILRPRMSGWRTSFTLAFSGK
jgi:8-oxo-dGTP diphosphatase